MLEHDSDGALLDRELEIEADFIEGHAFGVGEDGREGG